MNWDDTRIFLALTRTPSLRAAARSLGVDQATVGRRLNALESELGAKLFLRAKDGYLLTAAGETALAAARRMESAALELRTKIEGQDEHPGGLVRVTSTDSIAIDLLLPAVEQLQQQSGPTPRIWWCAGWRPGPWACLPVRPIWRVLANPFRRTSCAATTWWSTHPTWSMARF